MVKLSDVIDKSIREAILDAKKKGKLSVVSAITCISESRLNAISKGEEPEFMERQMLKAHISLPDKVS